MSDNRSGSSGAFVVGVLLGGAIGAVSGLLLAPRSGRETRQILKKSADALPELAEDLSSSVQIQADRLSGSALRNWDSTLGRLKEAIAAGLEASQRSAEEPPHSQPSEIGARPVAKPHTSASDAS